jgi:hypothetical protein
MSEDLGIFLEDLLDFLNGQEATIVKLKTQIRKLIGSQAPAQKSEDPNEKAVPELLFDWLSWLTEKGERLGIYEVAYQAQHLEKEWKYVHSILQNTNATIDNRYYPKDFHHSYWLFAKLPDRIYRQKLKKEDVSDGSAATG